MHLPRNDRRWPARARRHGITLIELMVVMGIIGILGAIAYPSYQDSVRKAKRAEGRAALMQVTQQQERYYSRSNRYIAFSSASIDAEEKKFKWFSGDSPGKSAYEISGTACKDADIADCVLLVAKPGTDRVDKNFKDAACGDLMLSSTGVKTASGTATNCWQ